MKPHVKRRWNVTAIWGAITAAAVGFAGMANWTVEMDKKMATTGSAAAANVRTISVLADHVKAIEMGDKVIKRKLRIRGAARDTLADIPPVEQPVGLMRRIFRLLF